MIESLSADVDRQVTNPLFCGNWPHIYIHTPLVHPSSESEIHQLKSFKCI